MRAILTFLILTAALSCTDEGRTVRVLRDQGFTNISTQGHAWNACGRDDTYCTAFEATNPNGHHVRGAVGCGAGCGKSCTIRFD